MELINQIGKTFSSNNKNIQVLGTAEEPWFVAKDVCNILELKDVSNALLSIPEKWKGTNPIRNHGGFHIPIFKSEVVSKVYKKSKTLKIFITNLKNIFFNKKNGINKCH